MSECYFIFCRRRNIRTVGVQLVAFVDYEEHSLEVVSVRPVLHVINIREGFLYVGPEHVTLLCAFVDACCDSADDFSFLIHILDTIHLVELLTDSGNIAKLWQSYPDLDPSNLFISADA